VTLSIDGVFVVVGSFHSDSLYFSLDFLCCSMSRNHELQADITEEGADVSPTGAGGHTPTELIQHKETERVILIYILILLVFFLT
jgi:hypothetical protein